MVGATPRDSVRNIALIHWWIWKQQILAFVNVQVSETGSSSKMEVEGFRRCMEFLLNKGFVIEVLATDRHVQIRSMMSKQFPGTEHQFDVWHLSNSVRKKLLKKSKYKGTEELGPWIKAICNHLWWCASHCEGNKVWLEESWCSIVNHVANQHTFDGDLVTRCAHGVLSNEQQRKKKWLKRDSKAHNAVKEVVLDKRLRKDIRQLSEFCHTGNLEVYHSLLTKYIPKRQEFDFDQMNCRTAIAVIDHNMSQNRPQKVDSQGNPVFNTSTRRVQANGCKRQCTHPRCTSGYQLWWKCVFPKKRTCYCHQFQWSHVAILHQCQHHPGMKWCQIWYHASGRPMTVMSPPLLCKHWHPSIFCNINIYEYAFIVQ